MGYFIEIIFKNKKLIFIFPCTSILHEIHPWIGMQICVIANYWRVDSRRERSDVSFMKGAGNKLLLVLGDPGKKEHNKESGRVFDAEVPLQ